MVQRGGRSRLRLGVSPGGHKPNRAAPPARTGAGTSAGSPSPGSLEGDDKVAQADIAHPSKAREPH